MIRLLVVCLAGALALPVQASEEEMVSGRLDKGDSVGAERGAYYDEHALELERGQLATIRLESADFDPFLVLLSPSGVLQENDDYGDGFDARIDVVADEAGTWTVRTTAYEAGSSGSYTLFLAPGEVAEIQVIEGRLDPRDARAIKGEFLDTYVMELEEQTSFVVELQSYGFDGFLVVESPDGKFWRNDDAGSFDKSRIGPLTPSRGDWTFHVTTVGENEVGAYDLKILYLPE